jgi:hypothetical protein
MSDDSYDGSGVLLAGGGFGQVEAGDLETVEKEAGAFGMHPAVGDTLEDFRDGSEDTAAVFYLGEFEVFEAITAAIFGRLAGGVVVVAELFVAQRRAAATAAAEEDMAALITPLFGLVGGLVWHGVSPLYLSPKVFERWGLSLNFGTDPGLNAKARHEAGLLVD